MFDWNDQSSAANKRMFTLHPHTNNYKFYGELREVGLARKPVCGFGHLLLPATISDGHIANLVTVAAVGSLGGLDGRFKTNLYAPEMHKRTDVSREAANDCLSCNP